MEQDCRFRENAVVRERNKGNAQSTAATRKQIIQGDGFALAALFILGNLLSCAGGSMLLSERLASSNDRVKRSAFAEMNSLDIASRQKYLDIVKKTLLDGNPENRLLAADSLGHMGSSAEVAIPDLIMILDDEHDDVRQHAEKALAQIGGASIPALLNKLNHRDTIIRCSAADALGFMGPRAEAAVPALAVLLSGPDYEVSRHAANALGFIGPASVPALQHAARAGNSQTTDIALAAFSVLKADRETVRELVQMMGNANESPGLRGFAARALGKMQEKAQEAIPDLVHAIGDENNEVRIAVEWALVQMGTAAIPALREQLADANPQVRSRVVRTLGSMGPAAENAVPALLQAMTDGDRVVRTEAISALEKMQTSSRQAVKALIRVMDGDSDGFVRLSAARALNKIGTHDAKEAVIRFNRRENPE